MPQPDFTPDELFVLNFLRSQTASRTSSAHPWGYIAGSAFLAGCGVYAESLAQVLVAFVVLAGFHIHEELYQRRWHPVWRSIIQKFEEALEANEDTTVAVNDAPTSASGE